MVQGEGKAAIVSNQLSLNDNLFKQTALKYALESQIFFAIYIN
jgi:hypothetical protein